MVGTCTDGISASDPLVPSGPCDYGCSILAGGVELQGITPASLCCDVGVHKGGASDTDPCWVSSK